MTEVEKMRSSQLADMSAPELQVRFEHAKKLLARMRGMSTYDEGYRELLEKLVPGIPETSIICPPFHCDHGDGIKLGEHVFVNANCTFLDGGYITIGTHTLVGPCVQIYTPHHPMDYQERRGSKEYAYPVTIGEDCWIGGGAIICPGVTIGNRCVIGAGSVVTKDIPDDSVAVGNPARVIRKSVALSGSTGKSFPGFECACVVVLIVKPFFGRLVFASETEVPGYAYGNHPGAFFNIHPIFGRG